MTSQPLTPVWDWEDPAAFDRRRAEADAEHSRHQRLELVTASRPITQALLRDLDVTGIEFGAQRCHHPHGLAADLITLQADDTRTEPHHIYRVDSRGLYTELDIANPLPFDTASIEWVHAEHLIEHVSLPTAIAWLTEVRRIVTPGGLVRLTTPDLRKYVHGYLDGSAFFAEHRRRIDAVVGSANPMPERAAFMVNQIFYLFGHRWIYDADELRHALTRAGFAPSGVSVQAFGKGQRPDVAALDREWRSDETLYVEALV